MKKIIPFNNVLNFSTDVREITAISLEHKINKYPDMISGVFYISGEYKITDGQLDKETFNFELPFDIALSNDYKEESLIVDIDDFRYDLISDKDLKVNIDLYVDGEIEEPLEREVIKETIDIPETISETEDSLLDEIAEEKEEVIEPERIELLKEMLTNNKENEMEKELDINITNDNDNDNANNNILNPAGEDTYVTYRVYKVMEGDTLDNILTKYNITKEMLADYNNIESIVPGDKLIIPTNEK
ncbi:MAG: LysM peptidoglycan-binding domain-containing protein [Bacilli bacterium]|nr:LysM peptidoglycan-binding domain-containing protein [Bacilli bacterium]